jgi:hypothetical protein
LTRSSSSSCRAGDVLRGHPFREAADAGRLKEHLAGAFPEDAPFAQEEDLPGTVLAGFVGPEVDERRELTPQNALGHRWIENNGRQERESLRWGYRRMADLRVSTTDPDASPMHHKKKKGASKLGYLTHYLVDLKVRRA